MLIWFFTVNLLDRRQTLLVDHIADLREAVSATRQTNCFEIAAFVVDIFRLAEWRITLR